MKCIECGSKYNRKNVCSNNECEYSYTPPKEKVGFKNRIKKIRYYKVSDLWYNLKNILIKRPDLIRTNLPKSKWMDTDGKLEAGMMKLFIDFVEVEEPWAIIEYKTLDDPTTNWSDKYVLLYKDIKLTYPKLIHDAETALSVWAEDHNVEFGHISENGYGEVVTTYDAPDEVQAFRWAELNRLDKEVLALETDILMRIVELRKGMWT